MRVLLLGPSRTSLETFLCSFGDEVSRTESPLDAEALVRDGWDWLVSYGYRHIIRQDVLSRFPGRIINLHISYLPWNRGADPNLWSFVEDTPKGVTIHVVDEGLDTGPILAQREVAWVKGDTLASSYERLSTHLEALFRDTWPSIRGGILAARPQPPGGSSHRIRDRARIEHLLVRGWNTAVETLIGQAKEPRP